MRHIVLSMIFALSLAGPVQAGALFETIPEKPDAAARYLVYIHGAGVDQGQGEEADHYPWLVKAFADRGFTVISEKRPVGRIQRSPEDLETYAEKYAQTIGKLIAAGVPPANITVVGYSRGAAIVEIAAGLIARSDIRYVLNAGCISETGQYKRSLPIREKFAPKMAGTFLSLRDAEDPDFGSCDRFFGLAPRVTEHQEIVVKTGRKHLAFSQATNDWLLPMVEFIDKH